MVSEGQSKTVLSESKNHFKGKANYYTNYGYQRWGFSFLELFCKNLNKDLAPKLADYEVYGREKEINHVYSTLGKLIKNTPCLVGGAGTGKTAIVEGIVVNILKEDLPPNTILHKKAIWELELSSIGGSRLLPNGERMETVGLMNCLIEELKHTKDRNIVFIDEVHQIIGSGANGISMQDIAETVKPVLARGEINLICATTEEEYRDSIEHNKALNRRITKISCPEPSVEEAIYIIDNIKKRFERTKNVKFDNDVVSGAVELSKRFIPEFFLPDKAIDLIDSAVANVIVEGRDRVTLQDIAEIISLSKGIPVDVINRVSSHKRIDYRELLSKRVKGQPYAINKVAKIIARSKQKLNDETSCRGSLFLVGTTGVGKTELAKAVAEIEFGQETEMIRIDCSEFNSQNALVRLIGSEDKKSVGILTDRVKRKPYSLVLFDEIDKAPQIADLFLQILDDGHLSTGSGEKVSFTDTFIIATTNEGAEVIKEFNSLKTGGIRELDQTGYDTLVDTIKLALSSRFRPEFLNRWNAIIVLNMLDEVIIREIVKLVSEKERRKLFDKNIELVFSNYESFFEYIVKNGTDVELGARPLNRLFQDSIVDEISLELELSGRTNEWYRIIVDIKGEAPKTFENGKREHFDRRTLELTAIKCNEIPKWSDTPTIVQTFDSNLTEDDDTISLGARSLRKRKKV